MGRGGAGGGWGEGAGEGGGSGGEKETQFETPLSIAKKENQPHAVTFPQLPGDCREQSPPKSNFTGGFSFLFFSRSSKGGSILGGVYIPRLTAPLASKFSTALDRAIEPPARETRTLGLGGAERPITVTTIRLSEISRHLHYRAWTRNERKQNTK